MKPSFRDRLKDPHPILFDGAIGTLLYQQGVFVNKAFEEVCLTNPKQIQAIHESYVDAGSEIIETNTFGANAYVLGQYGLEDQLQKINQTAVQLAQSTTKGKSVFIAGSIGQVYTNILGELDLKKVYQTQIDTLVHAGVDLLCLETFSNFDALQTVIRLARGKHDIPIVALVSIEANGLLSGDGLGGKYLCKALNDLNVDMVGFNCSIGPQAMTDFLLKHISYIKKPTCVMPNAGETHQVAGRQINLFTEEYFAKYVKRYCELGIHAIGGCCGIHPNHIRKASQTLRMLHPKMKALPTTQFAASNQSENQDHPPLPTCSLLHEKLRANQFVLSVEITAPKGMNSQNTLDTIQKLSERGVEHVNIPDGPRASARMSALLFVLEIIQKIKIEPILHYCLRDKNMLAILGELLALQSHGLKNLLIITGDPPKVGNYPNATAVFDFDSIGLLKLAKQFNHGLDFAGNDIPEFSGNYCLGTGCNHAALNMNKELDRLQQKIDAGAEYVISQPVFNVTQFESFMNLVTQKLKNVPPILCGVWPFASLRNAVFLKENVPGIEIEDSVIAKLSKYSAVEDQRKVGQSLASDVCTKLIPMISGISLAAPFNKFEVIDPVIEVIQKQTT
jgi:methionine synthase / methylenetetrahydrofolate reductase(NADPH)